MKDRFLLFVALKRLHLRVAVRNLRFSLRDLRSFFRDCRTYYVDEVSRPLIKRRILSRLVRYAAFQPPIMMFRQKGYTNYEGEIPDYILRYVAVLLSIPVIIIVFLIKKIITLPFFLSLIMFYILKIRASDFPEVDVLGYKGYFVAEIITRAKGNFPSSIERQLNPGGALYIIYTYLEETLGHGLHGVLPTYLFFGSVGMSFIYFISHYGLEAMGSSGKNTVSKYNVYGNFTLLFVSSVGLYIMVFVTSWGAISIPFGIAVYSISVYAMMGSRGTPFSNEGTIKKYIHSGVTYCVMLISLGGMYIIRYALDSNFKFTLIDLCRFDVHAAGMSPILTFFYSLFFGLFVLTLFFFSGGGPFARWVADSYESCAAWLRTFLLIVPKVAFILVFYNMAFFISSGTNLSVAYGVSLLFGGIYSVFYGLYGALPQHRLQRLLCYSSIFHSGVMMFVILSTVMLGQPSEAILVYIIYYVWTTFLLFMCLLLFSLDLKLPTVYISDLEFVWKRHPSLALAVSLIFFSLAGIPPAVGFTQKFYALNSIFFGVFTFEGSIFFGFGGLSPFIIFLVCTFFLLGIILATIYYLRVVKVLFSGNLPTIISHSFSEMSFKDKGRYVGINLCSYFAIAFIFGANVLVGDVVLVANQHHQDMISFYSFYGDDFSFRGGLRNKYI